MRFGLPQLSRKHDTEERAYGLVFGSIAWIAVFGIGSIIAVYVAALFTGISEGDGFPAFTLLSPSMVVPALALTLALVITFHLPLKKQYGLNRSEILFVAFVGFCVHTVMMGLDNEFLAPSLRWVVVAVWFLLGAVCIVALLRIAASWLRLVPKSWRSEDARTPQTRKPRTKRT